MYTSLYISSLKVVIFLSPAHDIPQFIRPTLANTFPTLDLKCIVWNK